MEPSSTHKRHPRPFHFSTFPKNDIPVFCPALTDGSIGDMMFFHSYKNPGLVLVSANLSL
jgi:hypothetical protein